MSVWQPGSRYAPSVAGLGCRTSTPSENGQLMMYKAFYAQYTHAREIGLDMLADEILDATAKPAPKGVDFRIWFDARRWYLSKLAPKRYGDKLSQELTGADNAPLVPNKIEVVFVSMPTKAPEGL